MRLKVAQAMDVRLGRQRAPQYEQGDHLVPYLRSANIENGRLSLDDVKEMNFTPIEQAIFELRPGDVLVTEGSGSADAVGTSAVWSGEVSGPVCFQNTLLRLRPRPGVTEGRYVAWWARHAHATRQFSTVATGANIQHLGSEGLKQLELDVPPLDDQRRIADFLDDQVARIDAVVDARRLQQSMVLAGGRAELSQCLHVATSDTSTMHGPLRRFVCTMDHRRIPMSSLERESRVGPFPYYGASGVIDHVDDFLFDEDLVLVSEDGANLVLRSSRVAFVARGRYWVNNHAHIVRPNDGCVVYWASVIEAANLRPWITGSAQPKLTGEALMSLPVAVPGDPAIRGRSELSLLRIQEESDGAIGRLAASVSLLTEYKQALISAAVSGEFDVTAASGRALPV